ncbi:M28 family peptidase [Candidatus Neomarinimicrobiota bacterium]
MNPVTSSRRTARIVTRTVALILPLWIFSTCQDPVDPGNRPPRIISPALVEAQAEELFTYIAEADDPDGDPVNFSFLGLPAWLIAAGDTVSGTPASAADSARFTVSASDFHGGADTLIVIVNVLPGPTDMLRELVGNMVAAVNLDTLQQFVRELSGEVSVALQDTVVTLVSRHKDYPGNALAADYLEHRLSGYGLPVTRQAFSETGENVYAVQEGTQGSAATVGAFIICAHYDSYPDSSIAPGADDDASGVALVLEAARLLSAVSTNWPVIYALWDEEEQGLRGSAHFAQVAIQLEQPIRGIINIDMIGWDSNDDRVLLVNTGEVADSYDLSDTFLLVNTYYNIGLDVKLVDPASGSDNLPFYWRGYSAIGVEEYYGEDWNIHYHTVDDRLYQFNLEYFHRASKAVIGTLATLAWTENDILARRSAYPLISEQ